VNIETLAGVIITIIFSAVVTLLKMQHDAAVARIKRLEEKVDLHHEHTHGELSRTLGHLEAKVQRREGKQ
jgi:hypothetical protein